MSSWTEAIEEACASAPADGYTLYTIEIIHPAFVDGNGDPDTIRIVLDKQDADLELEDSHLFWPGEVKTFTALGMEITEPSQEEGRFGEMQMAILNVPHLYRDWIKNAPEYRASARVIYREYVASVDGAGVVTPLGAPDRILTGLSLWGLRVTMTRIEATARFLDPLNQSFPTTVFDRASHPGLFGG